MKHHLGLLKLLLIGVVTFSYAMFQGGFVSWFLFYATLPFLLFATIIYVYPISKLSVSRSFSETDLTRGQGLDVFVTLKRSDWWPLYYAKVTDLHPFTHLEKQQRVIFLGFRREITLYYSIANLPRGLHTFEATEVEVVDLLGWVRKSRIVEERQTVIVYPKTIDFMYMPIAANFDQGAALARYQLHKESTVATGVREYQPGDRVSWIHWKSFAKNQTLRTKDFEERQAQDTLLYLDRTKSEGLDDTIDFTLSMISAMTKSDATGAFIIPGPGGLELPVVTHQGHYEKARRHLATLEAVPEKQMIQILSEESRLGKYKGVLYMTSQLEQAFVEALVRATPQVREGICFVVQPEYQRQPEVADSREATYLKARGWHVVTLTPSQFTEAFREVGQR